MKERRRRSCGTASAGCPYTAFTSSSSHHTSVLLLLLLLLSSCSCCSAASAAAATNETATITPRIVGGVDTTGAQYPFYAFATANELCGGTLVATDFILTAAHCAPAFAGSVFVGGTDTLYSAQRLVVSVERTIVHPNYQPGPELNDIMLVQLHPNSVPTDHALVELNTEVDLEGNGIVIGFGQTTEGGSLSGRLQEVTVPIWTDEECQEPLSTYVHPEMHVCAGTDGFDSCGGDSGGPLLDAQDVFLQYGIVSFGIGCGRPNRPGVYIRTSLYYDWIASHVCTQSSNPPLSLCPRSENSETDFPTGAATTFPTNIPTLNPTFNPTVAPSDLPSDAPSDTPTNVPSAIPSVEPTTVPSGVPTAIPSDTPTIVPSTMPSDVPSHTPSDMPSDTPTVVPSTAPSTAPSPVPSVDPTRQPSTLIPTAQAAPATLVAVVQEQTPVSSWATNQQPLLPLSALLVLWIVGR